MSRKRQPQFDPEEVLADIAHGKPGTRGEHLEWPIRTRTVLVSFWVVLVLFGLFAARLFPLGVVQSSLFSRLAAQSRERTVLLTPIRGSIFDAHGVPLVENLPRFTLVLDPLSAQSYSGAEREEDLRMLAEHFEVPLEVLRERSEVILAKAEPRPLFDVISREDAVALEAMALPEYLFVETKFQRVYPQGGETLAHVLGYLGVISQEELDSLEGYTPRDYIGRTGLERVYEKTLRGIAGRRTVFVDAKGRAQSVPEIVAPTPGLSLRLAVDAAFSDSIRVSLASAIRRTGSTGGSVVAIDPRNGKVLALVSLPTYDAAEVSGGLSSDAYRALAEDPSNPFLNRAISGLYPSGSTVKPFVAAAALAENIISPWQRLDASQGFIRVTSVYDPNVSWIFRDWKPHGFVNMIDAIARSSNVYFYMVGGGYEGFDGLGPDLLRKHLSAFGFGRALGIDLPGEAEGRIPTPAWKETMIGEPWYIGDTYNLSIGQGNFLVTPLQLAVATAAIANGGTVYQPQIVESILTPDGTELQSVEPKALGTVPATPDDLAFVARGMREAVTSSQGTNRALAGLPFAVAAKTGTAQFGSEGKTHALVTAFAPYQDPKLVVVVLLEGGGQGTEATAVAREIFEWYATYRHF